MIEIINYIQRWIDYYMSNMSENQIIVNLIIIITSICLHNQSINYYYFLNKKSKEENFNNKAYSLLFRFCFMQIFLGMILLVDTSCKMMLGYLFGIMVAGFFQIFKAIRNKCYGTIFYSIALIIVYCKAIEASSNIYNIL